MQSNNPDTIEESTNNYRGAFVVDKPANPDWKTLTVIDNGHKISITLAIRSLL